jgi:hypothetical protein
MTTTAEIEREIGDRLDGLLLRLENEGLEIGIRDRVMAGRIAAHVVERQRYLSPGRRAFQLRARLTSVLARSPDDVKRIRRVFLDVFPEERPVYEIARVPPCRPPLAECDFSQSCIMAVLEYPPSVTTAIPGLCLTAPQTFSSRSACRPAWCPRARRVLRRQCLSQVLHCCRCQTRDRRGGAIEQIGNLLIGEQKRDGPGFLQPRTNLQALPT